MNLFMYLLVALGYALQGWDGKSALTFVWAFLWGLLWPLLLGASIYNLQSDPSSKDVIKAIKNHYDRQPNFDTRERDLVLDAEQLEAAVKRGGFDD